MTFALRSLRRTPMFALTAALVLGLGIGANAAIFTIVNALLLRPLPFANADDIVQVRRRTPTGASGSFSMHDYLPLTVDRRALSSIAILDVFAAGRSNMTTDGATEPVAACRVSAEFFSVLGLSPLRGRLFIPGDDEPGRAPTAVVTRAFWERRFGADETIVGRTLAIAGQPHTVVGVVPDAIRAFGPADIYVSLPVPAASRDRTNSFQVLGRIAANVTGGQAAARLDAAARRHADANPSTTNMPQGVVLQSLQDVAVGAMRPALQALMAAVGLLLLIACSNVANLVLARALSRRREMAVMAALGASRWRLVWRVLAENLLIASAGGAVGLLLADVGVRALPAFGILELPQSYRIQIDGYVLTFVAITALVAGVLAALPQIVQLAGGDAVQWLKATGGERGSTAGGRRVRMALSVAQIGLSTILLVGAGLLTRTFWNLATVDPGFRADGVLTTSVTLAPSRYPGSARVGEYADTVVDRLERIPGVLAASSTTALPSEFPIDFPFAVVGRTASVGTAAAVAPPLDAWYRAINPHYFAAMAIPLRSGRLFSALDSAAGAPVVIVSEALARTAFPNGDALGQAIIVGPGYLTEPRDLRPRTIVGIVGDTREQGLRFAPTMTMYLPVAQSPERITRLMLEKIPLRFVLRTSGPPEDVATAVRQAVAAVDSTQPAADFASMTSVLARSIAANRFNMMMLALFSGIALTLAAIGVYGLTAYAVVQRTREIGIKLSLGASPRRVVRGLMVEGLRLALAGGAIGLVGALLVGRLLRALLFGVSATDGPTIGLVIASMTAVVAVATWLPASRAAKLDPVVALRQE